MIDPRRSFCLDDPEVSHVRHRDFLEQHVVFKEVCFPTIFALHSPALMNVGCRATQVRSLVLWTCYAHV